MVESESNSDPLDTFLADQDIEWPFPRTQVIRDFCRTVQLDDLAVRNNSLDLRHRAWIDDRAFIVGKRTVGTPRRVLNASDLYNSLKTVRGYLVLFIASLKSQERTGP